MTDDRARRILRLEERRAALTPAQRVEVDAIIAEYIALHPPTDIRITHVVVDPQADAAQGHADDCPDDVTDA